MKHCTEMDDAPSGSTPLLNSGYLIRERWEILKRIGGGGFGEIYKAKDHNSGQTCAVKVESCNSPKQVLKMEVAVLKRLQGITPHACEFLGCGRNEKVNYMVMTLLGPSLSELRKRQPHQRFSISTVLRVGIQIISSVRAIHNCGFLHRDIKPSNFAIGTTPETSRTCYMLDFGLARQYTTLTGEVRQPRPVAGFRGTVRYASINAHQSKDLGRHDDLWSVFYMLVELAVGHLPWRRIREKEEAGESKAKYDHKKLIRGMPIEFQAFLDHLRSLSYFQKPDYVMVTNILKSAIKRLGIQDSDPFDWEQDFSAPSLTTASVGSPPAVKLEKVGHENSPQVPMLKKLDPSSSKTNCSEVVDLSEHGDSKLPPQAQQTAAPPRDTADIHQRGSPRLSDKYLASVSDNKSKEQRAQCPIVVDDINIADLNKEDHDMCKRHSKSDTKSQQEENERSNEKGKIEEDVVIQIDNRYESEETTNTQSDTVSSSTDSEIREQRENEDAIQPYFVPTPMKSIHTESLNRFFEMGPSKGSSESIQLQNHHISLTTGRETKLNQSEKSSHEQNMQPVSVPLKFSETAHRISVHPETNGPGTCNPIYAYQSDDSDQDSEHKTKPNLLVPKPDKDVNSKDLEIKQTAKLSDPRSMPVNGVHSLPVTTLRLKTNNLRESDSSKSVNVTNVRLVLTETVSANVPVSSSVAPHTKVPVHAAKGESVTNGQIILSKQMAIAPKGVQPRKLPPTPTHANIDRTPSKFTINEHKPKAVGKDRDTCTSTLFQESSAIPNEGKHLSEAHPPTLTPQPPTRPPPSTYSSCVSARRKRFLRPQVK